MFIRCMSLMPGDDSGCLLVVEQPGRIRIIRNGALIERPFLDISQRVRSSGVEQGLLGLAFHPDYRNNGRYVVNYTRVPDAATVIAEYRVSGDPSVSQTTERVLLVIPQPYPNHKGGMVDFGPDGLLYIGMGDGGSGGDPENRAQDREELLGKILRIDVDGGVPTQARRTIPSRSAAAVRRFSRTASAIRGAFRSTGRRAICGWLTSVRMNGKRSISSSGAAITAGGSWKATIVFCRRAVAREKGWWRRSRSIETGRLVARSPAATSIEALVFRPFGGCMYTATIAAEKS